MLSASAPRLAEKKASIGYTYEDSTVAELENSLEKRGDEEDSEEDSNTDEDEVIPDIGKRGASWALRRPPRAALGFGGRGGGALSPPPCSVDVEVDVDELNQEQVADLNKQATTYGMADGDFVR